jgi:hypothetical protein
MEQTSPRPLEELSSEELEALWAQAKVDGPKLEQAKEVERQP